MATIRTLTEITSAIEKLEGMKASYQDQPNVIKKVAELQLLLCNVLASTINGPVLIDGLTEEEAGYARKTDGTGKIPAIKLVRERTGMGLAEAKRHVEEWQRRAGVATNMPTYR